MEPTRNDLGQLIGFPLPAWSPPPAPPREPMQGRYCRLEPLDPDRHAAALFEADAPDADGRSWTYLAYGPFRTLSEYRGWMGATCLGDDPLFFAILDMADGKAAGVASYLRITPAAGSIEVGHIHYSPRLRRSQAATEAMFLMMRWAFESGYRRYEWKCDALNAASRAAACQARSLRRPTLRPAAPAPLRPPATPARIARRAAGAGGRRGRARP